MPAEEEYFDAFGNKIDIGDEIATISYSDNIPYRGIIIRLGKGQVKIDDNYRTPAWSKRWVGTHRAIRTRTKEQLELEQN